MSKILLRIERKKGLDYRVDRKGNVIESRYNWFKDKTTLVMLVVLLLGGLYYSEMSKSETNAENFDKYCMMYSMERENFIIDNPGVEVNIGNVLRYVEDKELQSFNTSIPNIKFEDE